MRVNIVVCSSTFCQLKLDCFNFSPFYRRKSSESASLPAGILPHSTEVCEASLRADVNGRPVDQRDGWSNVNHLSSISVDSVTEVIPAVYGQFSLSSSSQRTLGTNTSTWSASGAANSVPNNG